MERILVPAGRDEFYKWRSFDRHISESEFLLKADEGRVLFISADEVMIGVVRFGMFWDEIPFLNLIYIREDMRGLGYGRRAMTELERQLIENGRRLLLTSTQADETAQMFYRRLGYRDIGGFILPFRGYEQPTELILGKELSADIGS